MAGADTRQADRPRPASNRTPDPKDLGPRFLIVVFLATLLLAMAVNLAYTLLQTRTQIMRSQYETSENLVRLLEQQTADALNALELALHATARNVQSMRSTGPQHERAVQDLLLENIRNLPFVRAIWILAPNGDMIHDSERLPGKYNLSDRDYFQAQRTQRTPGMYIEGPLRSKHGVSFIAASVRISLPDGGFGGVVVAAFEPKHFGRFYRSIKQGDTGVVALMRSDGGIMLRVPEGPAPAAGRPEWTVAANGTPSPAADAAFRADSGVDGIERIYAYRKVAERPLAVLVGVGEREVLAPWRNMALAYSVGTAIFTVALVVLGYFSLRELRRRTELRKVLIRSEADLAAAQRLSRTGSWTYLFAKNIGNWSSEMYEVLGMAADDGVPPLPVFLSRIHPEDRDRLEQALHHEASWRLEVRTNPEHGPVRHLSSRGEEILGADGEVIGKAGTLQDVTERRAMDEKLGLAACVFDRMQDGIVVTDPEGKVLAMNRAGERITGYQEADILAKDAGVLLVGEQESMARMVRTVQAGREWRGEIGGKKQSGAYYPLRLTLSVLRDLQHRQRGFVAVFTDLSEVKEATEQVAFLSSHDPLTRLPNRRLMLGRLQAALERARQTDARTAALVINLDRLQRVNETFGRGAGDEVVTAIASRLSGIIPHTDLIGSLLGDEFVVVLPQVTDTNDIITVAHRILEAVAEPVVTSNSTISVTASMGIAVAPQDGDAAEDLLKNGATALSHAKQDRPGSMRFYEGAMNARAVRWTLLEQELRLAPPGGQIVLHYQPKLSLADGRISGVEALMRWRSPKLGNVSPAEFIPIAEDSGMIGKLGRWAIHEACRQSRTWRDRGIHLKSVAVNVSSRQFSSGDLLEIVQEALAENDVPPSALEIELTETALVEESASVYRQITALRKLGVRVALDDFGTGYSSLSYLSELAFDKVKIDQSFVRGITSDARSASIARATVAMAHGLGMEVVAEGVESAAQLDWLRNIGCNEVQGYLISRPVLPEELEALHRHEWMRARTAS